MSETLVVVRDDVELPEEQARAIWRAYLEHMERTDNAEGFARNHGFLSVRESSRRGKRVLVLRSRASMPPPALASSTRRKSSMPPMPAAAGARRRGSE